jgi:two-component system, OmpR family, sensor histidine kinase KdpD
MAGAPSPPTTTLGDFTWTIAGILGLLIITVLSIVPLTLSTIQSRESETVLIDTAGRQRMLLERHLEEVILFAQGVDTSYAHTRLVLRERLRALIHGGRIPPFFDLDTEVSIPSASTDEIRARFIEQQNLLESLVVESDGYLQTPMNSAQQKQARDALHSHNAKLVEVANTAVVLMIQHSSRRLQQLIRWEIAAVLLVVMIASIRTWRFLQAEKALRVSQRATLEALRQNDALKSALVSSVSHDLRTPLTAIKTMLYSLGDDAAAHADGVRKELVLKIDQEIDYLDRLIDNLLDMSRIEAGALIPKKEWHVLDELVEGAIRRVDRISKEHQLEVQLAPDLPPIFVDGLQIQQVLVNLLDNAIKYSSPGSPIRLTASLMEDSLEVGVSNDGEGLPTDELGRIFERFYRVRSGSSAATPGLGLGLAICKSIIETHGGSIVAHSVPGGTTTISFRLPLTKTMPISKQLVAHA